LFFKNYQIDLLENKKGGIIILNTKYNYIFNLVDYLNISIKTNKVSFNNGDVLRYIEQNAPYVQTKNIIVIMDYSCNSSKDKSSNQVEANAKEIEGESFHNLNTSPYSIDKNKLFDKMAKLKLSSTDGTSKTDGFQKYLKRFLKSSTKLKANHTDKLKTRLKTHLKIQRLQTINENKSNSTKNKNYQVFQRFMSKKNSKNKPI